MAKAAERAQGRGAQVRNGPMEVPGGVWMAVSGSCGHAIRNARVRNGKRAEVGDTGRRWARRRPPARFLADPRDDGLFALAENDVSGIR
jgi:hypothetical protein